MRTIFIGILLIVFFTTHTSSAQTKLELAQKEWKGFVLGIGATKTFFLNQNFHQNLDAGKIAGGIGVDYIAQIRFHPFFLEFSYFNSGFKQNQLSMTVEDRENTIRHYGFESQLNFSLIPDSKRIAPYLGAGYMVGGIKLPHEASKIDTQSYIDLSDFMMSIGFQFKFNSALFNIYYKRTVSLSGKVDRLIYRFGLSWAYKFSKR